MRLYLSGPMTGYNDHNRPLFERAARALWRMDHIPMTPFDAEAIHPASDWGDWMRADAMLLRALPPDGIVMLPGWRESYGARAEWAFVTGFMGLPAYRFGLATTDTGLELVRLPAWMRDMPGAEVAP